MKKLLIILVIFIATSVAAKPIVISKLDAIYLGSYDCLANSSDKGLNFEKGTFAFGTITNNTVIVLAGKSKPIRTYYNRTILRNGSENAITTKDGVIFTIDFDSNLNLYYIIIFDKNDKEILRMICRKKWKKLLLFLKFLLYIKYKVDNHEQRI